ncbi:cupin domain-containing protein [Methylophaga pinxianii]|uniref:cupin domain-containing protein n=1 Tax=Methylophaga pinxianii TaxID=2881052 RepID=UPI001CF3C302|nr:cupin domain-containing protein [Methylophaga pinxianii]MCB2426786.1 cupin domain-containing protein [Methylophaga pinxianii]UPH46551.1 cupin domain-containing protein [Methylophaga pinxianii]
MLRFNGRLGIVLLATASYAIADEQAYKGQNLLQSEVDVLGQPLVYPSGTPRVTSDIITLAPGEAGKPHIHQIPMFAYVLSGVISVDYGDHGVRTYKQGEALMEAQNMVHFGFNNSSDPVSLLVVYIGSAELSNAELP